MAAGPKAGAKKSFIAKTHVRHDGKGYPRGSKLKLSAEDSERLVKLKAVAPADGSAAGDDDESTDPDDQGLGGEANS